MTTHPTTPPPTHPTHHCLYCQEPLTRFAPDYPWKNPRGDWRCPRHPRAGESTLTPHMSVPGPPVDRPR